MGHLFPTDAWLILERLALLSPCLNFSIESTPDIDENFSKQGNELDIPVVSEV